METKFNVFETNLDVLGLSILDENEAMKIDGGDHYELIDGKLVWFSN